MLYFGGWVLHVPIKCHILNERTPTPTLSPNNFDVIYRRSLFLIGLMLLLMEPQLTSKTSLGKSWKKIFGIFRNFRDRFVRLDTRCRAGHVLRFRVDGRHGRRLEHRPFPAVPPPGSVHVRAFRFFDQILFVLAQHQIVLHFIAWRDVVLLKNFPIHFNVNCFCKLDRFTNDNYFSYFYNGKAFRFSSYVIGY